MSQEREMASKLIDIYIRQKEFTKAMDLLLQFPQESSQRVDFSFVAHSLITTGSAADLEAYMQALVQLGSEVDMHEHIYLLSLLWTQKNYIVAALLIDQLLPAYIQPLTLCIHQWEQDTLPTPTALHDAMEQWNS